MANSDIKADKKEITKEKNRLKKIFKDIEEKRKATTEGLIERAAFMKVKLSALEKDIDEHGFTELFSQGNQTPYERQRPSANIYCTMNTSYQKIIKQLTDLLPKEAPKPTDTDNFDDFVSGRDG